METPAWRRRLRRLAVKQLVARLRDGPCARCGGRGEDHVFAHLGRPSKFAIGDAPRRKPAALARELMVTTRLCAACHTLACAGRLAGEDLPTMPAPDLDVWYAVAVFAGSYSFSITTARPAEPHCRRPPGGSDTGASDRTTDSVPFAARPQP
jgi:hypothetical protein